MVCSATASEDRLVDRNAIYDALFATGSGTTWGEMGETWQYTSQRLDLWTDCPAQPAFYQVAHDNDFQQVSNMPYRVELMATWVIYQNGAQDRTVQGSRLNNTILDALQAAMVPRPEVGLPYNERNTLGGLVWHAFIGGQSFQDGGDLDGQGVMTIPIRILVP